eukprot:CAMPEP_0174364466 /NCGR_PEP_ID=MMETSP0811_2-20130205/73007_1 /TAXON_ID=73025 ORGANISM="Eutreptiella gymnastica-like, Strain CCMP1594" /NCGR_SAMPLE_ID=MMETSP0811_2 /ASSEMBLY_ACC=CAM_ASM_000667 /LENGTH=79 /DNA_ID=CAMNT_0015504119 /DNA_START=15 /DNA_END=251 /DNA_ORIENTATION=-
MHEATATKAHPVTCGILTKTLAANGLQEADWVCGDARIWYTVDREEAQFDSNIAVLASRARAHGLPSPPIRRGLPEGTV